MNFKIYGEEVSLVKQVLEERLENVECDLRFYDGIFASGKGVREEFLLFDPEYPDLLHKRELLVGLINRLVSDIENW